MIRKLLIVTLACNLMTPSLPLMAQDFCAPEPVCQTCIQDYKLVSQTIYEEKPVTTRRLQTETILEERQVVRYRPVWETTMRERRYTVNKPVVQTSMREERKTVMRPVYEVRYRDRSYDRVRYVAQTSSRTERRVVSKPVVETTMQTQQRVVQKPVTTTVMQDQVSTAYKPLTTYYQRTVDQGGFVDQLRYEPGETRHRLRWQNGQCQTDPLTGQSSYQRPGLYWQPRQLPGKYTAAKAYVPNPVVQQLAQTQYVPEQVVQKVPVNVTQLQSEVQTRQVPIQTVRMQQEEQFRTVPVTVQKPVVERIPRYVPEYRVRMVAQEYVRQVPVNTYKYVQEERVEQIPVRTCKMVRETKTIEVPRQQSRWVEEVTMRQIPRTVVMKVPVDSYGSTFISHSPVEYDHRIISDSADGVDAYSYDQGGIEDGTLFSGSSGVIESNRLPIEDPIAEPESDDDDSEEPEIAPIPRGSRPSIESSWRSIKRTAKRPSSDYRQASNQLIRLSAN